MARAFKYLDLDTIEGGWSELFRDAPLWVTEVRKEIYAPLEKDAELDLIRIAKYGSGPGALAAKETVIRRNLRFVVNITRHYLHHGIETGELISTGNEALIAAFEKFDPERDVKFITYAVNLIRAAMISLLRSISAVKLSVSAVQLLNDYILLGDVQAIKDTFPDRYTMKVEKLEAKLNEYLSIRYMGSLDEQYDNGDAKSDNIESKEDTLFTYGGEIRDILDTVGLDKLESKVIHLNFGLGGDKPLGLRKIASKIGTNLSAVAKVRTSALAKLAKNERLSQMLEDVQESDAISWAHPKNLPPSD